MTAELILDAAQKIAQSVGYGGLSYRDVAAAVGIKSASVHYHFPSKGQLGAALARRYTDRLVRSMQAADVEGDAPGALTAYVRGSRTALEQDGRMCLCGILAAETDAIPEEVRAEVRRFVEVNVAWLARVIERITGAPAGDAGTQAHARAILAALEGAMLVARGTGDIAGFDATVAQFWRTGLLPGG